MSINWNHVLNRYNVVESPIGSFYLFIFFHGFSKNLDQVRYLEICCSMLGNYFVGAHTQKNSSKYQNVQRTHWRVRRDSAFRKIERNSTSEIVVCFSTTNYIEQVIYCEIFVNSMSLVCAQCIFIRIKKKRKTRKRRTFLTFAFGVLSPATVPFK